MRNKQIALSAVVSACLSLSGPTFAAPTIIEPVQTIIEADGYKNVPVRQTQQGEQVTTNVLLRQILAEVIKANSQKEDKRCSDGEKHYSPGYIISTGKQTLRCDISSGYPEWVEGGTL